MGLIGTRGRMKWRVLLNALEKRTTSYKTKQNKTKQNSQKMLFFTQETTQRNNTKQVQETNEYISHKEKKKKKKKKDKPGWEMGENDGVPMSADCDNGIAVFDVPYPHPPEIIANCGFSGFSGFFSCCDGQVLLGSFSLLIVMMVFPSSRVSWSPIISLFEVVVLLMLVGLLFYFLLCCGKGRMGCWLCLLFFFFFLFLFLFPARDEPELAPTNERREECEREEVVKELNEKKRRGNQKRKKKRKKKWKKWKRRPCPQRTTKFSFFEEWERGFLVHLLFIFGKAFRTSFFDLCGNEKVCWAGFFFFFLFFFFSFKKVFCVLLVCVLF